MNSLITDYLAEVLDEVRDDTAGEVPTYIPALQKADPNWLGVALCTVSGNVYSTGDSSPEFTIQSVSKPFAYALALQEFGIDKVREHVGMEPSGEAFNELSLEEEDKRPLNAMINVGAITINQLLNGTDSTVEDRVEYIRKYFSELAGRELRIDEDAVEGEIEGADRNLSIAHMLRSYGIIHDEAHDAVLSYTQQCSILVTIEDLAVMSATLANGGVNPKTGKKILDADVCRHTMAVMASCGMYDAAGRWLAKVGIPAKSGVSGGLIGALPGQLGIASLSPRLDEVGNSVRGVTVFEHLSDDMGMHLMNTENRAGSHAVRSITRDGDCTTVHIQGIVNFVAAEAIVEVLNQHDFTTGRVLLDVSRIVESHPIARRMLKEGLRRLREDGHEIGVIDPEGEFRSRVLDDGSRLPLVE